MSHRWTGFAAILALATGVFGCAAGNNDKIMRTSPVTKGPNSLEATRRALEGTWTLVSLDVIDVRGNHRPVKATGELTYDAFGAMTVKAQIEDQAASNSLMINYTGRIVIDTTKSEFRPADLESAQPVDPTQVAPISPDKIRRFAIADDTLIVTYFDAASTPTAMIRWRRTAGK